MRENNDILFGYENMPLIHYTDAEADRLNNVVAYEELPERSVAGVLKVNRHVDGKLVQTYSTQENHVGVIAATRLGKTTSYVVPTIISFARQKVKRGMIISDPKGELYRITSETLRSEGYKVKLLNFRDYLHSECWNMLTPIFRKYRAAVNIASKARLIDRGSRQYYEFQGELYTSRRAMDKVISRVQKTMIDGVFNEVEQVALSIISTSNQKDPYWEDSAREVLKAGLIAMLEDSMLDENPVTEETFSINTLLDIFSHFSAGEDKRFYDGGYFTNRPQTSRARKLVDTVLVNNAGTTAGCILSVFNTKISVFKDVAPRVITSANSFEMAELTDGPTAVFIDYRDELKVHYDLIAIFVQEAYRFLIGQANDTPSGKLDVPFYFILDEFGNFPALPNFETVISASGGRNIFFIIILQSYAQLANVYGNDVAAIIRDNLNMHIFFGSNNPDTLEAFSKECGQITRISPLSALDGSGVNIEKYQIETIANVPKSMLSHLEPGECIITEANSGYVMYSRLERYFLCGEFKDLPQADCRTYKCPINPFDDKYTYEHPVFRRGSNRNIFDRFNFDFGD